MDSNTIFLSNLSHQRDSTAPHRTETHRTAPHYAVCDRILKKYYRYIVRDIYRYIYRYFLPRYKDRYTNRYIGKYTVTPTVTVIIVTAC